MLWVGIDADVWLGDGLNRLNGGHGSGEVSCGVKSSTSGIGKGSVAVDV